MVITVLSVLFHFHRQILFNNFSPFQSFILMRLKRLKLDFFFETFERNQLILLYIINKKKPLTLSATLFALLHFFIDYCQHLYDFLILFIRWVFSQEVIQGKILLNVNIYLDKVHSFVEWIEISNTVLYNWILEVFAVFKKIRLNIVMYLKTISPC